VKSSRVKKIQEIFDFGCRQYEAKRGQESMSYFKVGGKMRPKLEKQRTRKRGSTLVEFAFIVPVLILLVLGIIEFGWMAKNRLQLANAVREGARSAAIGKSTTQIEQLIKDRSAGIPGVPAQLTITMKRDDDGETNGFNYNTTLGNKAADSSGNVYNDAPAGALIQVTASLPHISLTGLPFSNGRTLEITVVMRREPGM
jgi:Flp pilus assembly protein TadG